MNPFNLLAVLRRNRFAVLVLLLLPVGCSPIGLALGAGATTAVAAAEERGISGAATDTAIRVKINKLWLDTGGWEMYRKVGLQVHEGRVLLSGAVPTVEMQDTAVRLAWQPDGVHEVINELRVSRSSGLATAARDKWISAQVKTRLMFDEEVDAINYSARTVDGNVYLIGLARSEQELQRVFEVVRSTKHVRSVVSYVLLRDDPRRTG